MIRLAALAIVALLGVPQDAPRPNVIVIHADDLGWGDLSCYGQKRFSTPRLDRMAAEGTRYTAYYAGSTVCAPSRCALMTGYHMGHAEIRGNSEAPLRAEDVTVAKLLKQSGYATSLIGKWGLGLEKTSGSPPLQGFDESFGYLNQRHAHRQYVDHLFRNGEKVAVPEDAWANDLFEKEALDFVERKKDGPFFLYLAFTNPHAELWVPDDSLAEFKGKFEETPWDAKTGPGPKGSGPGYPSYRSQATPKAAFAAMIARMDRAVGRLLDKLKALGIDERTLVLFTSDNGPHKEGGADPEFFDSNGPFRGIKRDLTEGGIRVPMIARWPGRVPAGRVSDFVWAHWDLLPTACALAGVKAPEGLDGLSVAEELQGRPQKGHDSLYWEFFERGYDQAVRHGDWKGIRNGFGAPLQLYDLAADPGETKDLAAEKPDVVAKLDAILKSSRTEHPKWVPAARKGAK